MHILLIDNYDSFTFNLVHYLESFDAQVTVWRNDEIDFNQLEIFDYYVLSPGPGLPKDSGQLMKFIELTYDKKPTLGVCLGFQALVEFFGGKLYNQNQVKHGVAETCLVKKTGALLRDIPSKIQVGLYHSWAADEKDFPDELVVTAVLENNTIMAFEHQSKPIYGVQFHPESVLTEYGKKMIANFLRK